MYIHIYIYIHIRGKEVQKMSWEGSGGGERVPVGYYIPAAGSNRLRRGGNGASCCEVTNSSGVFIKLVHVYPWGMIYLRCMRIQSPNM